LQSQQALNQIPDIMQKSLIGLCVMTLASQSHMPAVDLGLHILTLSNEARFFGPGSLMSHRQAVPKLLGANIEADQSILLNEIEQPLSDR
jgi:hypothetical protein